jgi:hypothetical protein
MKKPVNLLADFDLDNLDTFESMRYRDLESRSSLTKANLLQIIINTAEGDYSQLSPQLAEIAEYQDVNQIEHI